MPPFNFEEEEKRRAEQNARAEITRRNAANTLRGIRRDQIQSQKDQEAFLQTPGGQRYTAHLESKKAGPKSEDFYEGSVEIEKIIPALGAIGGAIGSALGAAEAAKKIGSMLSGGGGGGGEEGTSEQDAHAQTEWENIHNSKSIQKLMSFVQKEESEEEPEEEDVDEGLADRMKGG